LKTFLRALVQKSRIASNWDRHFAFHVWWWNKGHCLSSNVSFDFIGSC